MDGLVCRYAVAIRRNTLPQAVGLFRRRHVCFHYFVPWVQLKMARIELETGGLYICGTLQMHTNPKLLMREQRLMSNLLLWLSGKDKLLRSLRALEQGFSSLILHYFLESIIFL